MAEEIWLQGANAILSAFSTAAHFTQADQSIVGFDLHDGTNKSSPVCSVRVTQRSFQRNGHGCANVYDLHGFFCFECADFGDSTIICSTTRSIGSNALSQYSQTCAPGVSWYS